MCLPLLRRRQPPVQALPEQGFRFQTTRSPTASPLASQQAKRGLTLNWSSINAKTQRGKDAVRHSRNQKDRIMAGQNHEDLPRLFLSLHDSVLP